jgi:hypothetical protein
MHNEKITTFCLTLINQSQKIMNVYFIFDSILKQGKIFLPKTWQKKKMFRLSKKYFLSCKKALISKCSEQYQRNDILIVGRNKLIR